MSRHCAQPCQAQSMKTNTTALLLSEEPGPQPQWGPLVPQGGGGRRASLVFLGEQRGPQATERAGSFPHTGRSQMGTHPPGSALQQEEERTGGQPQSHQAQGTNAQAATALVSTRLGPGQKGTIRMINRYIRQKTTLPRTWAEHQDGTQAHPSVGTPESSARMERWLS